VQNPAQAAVFSCECEEALVTINSGENVKKTNSYNKSILDVVFYVIAFAELLIANPQQRNAKNQMSNPIKRLWSKSTTFNFQAQIHH
jgi:hypothetical protein